IFIPEWDVMLGTGFYTDDIDAVVEQMEATTTSALHKTLSAIVMFYMLIAAAVFAFAVMVNRTIMKPIKLLDTSIRSFASGEADLTARMDDFNAPEFSELSRSFNAFVASLQSIISSVSTVGHQVVAETNSMSARAAQVDEIASGQREETEQVATA
ncbi:chemotaxis protein, partial [Vibrio xuii]